MGAYAAHRIPHRRAFARQGMRISEFIAKSNNKLAPLR
jgi:hypothetical protein